VTLNDRQIHAQQIDDRKWTAAVDVISQAKSLLLLGHVSPDGDALGSALAVGLALRDLGSRRVQVSFGDDPFVVPANLANLPGLDLLVSPSEITGGISSDGTGAPDVVVTFDASSADRLGVLRSVGERAKTLLAVDHHSSYDGFGSMELVDVTAPATAVIADELIRRLGADLTRDIAACLYTGLVTDTGSFRYPGTTSATHEFAGRLLDTGIAFDEITRELFDSAPFSYLGLLGQALDTAQFEPSAAGGFGLVWTSVPAAERQRRGLAFDLVEPIIDVVRRAVEAEVAVVLKEDDTGELRVSMRSKGQVDVSKVASALGGGGHRYAAGFTAVSREPSTVMADVRQALAVAAHEPA
jgi:phosphoesterase RecJ-like protein